MIFGNPQDSGRSEWRITLEVLRKTAVICALLWVGLSWGLPSRLCAQNQGPRRSATNESTPVLPGQSSATIGQSGFRVPIPEIKMNRIIGGPKKRGPEQTAPPSVEPPAGQPSQAVPRKSREESGERPTVSPPPARSESTEPAVGGPARPSEAIPRKSREENEERPTALPPPAQSESTGPAVERPAPLSEPPPALPRESVRTQPSGPKRAPREESFQPAPTGKPESRPSTTMEPAPRAKEDGGQKEETEAVVTAPQAPEDVTAPPPPPRKELLRPTSPTHLPGLLKNAPGKEGPPALAIQRSEADDLADPREWVQLDKRRLPEIEPPAELEPLPQEKTGDSGVELPMPAPGPQPAKEAKPKPEPIAEAVTEHNTGDAGPVEMLPPSGRTEATRPPVAEQKPEKETRPLPTAIEPPSTGSPPKEAISPSEGQPSPPKEVIPSPLDDAALESPAVREYLRQAAPILEELSVLMTTAPSLNLADYDPSDSPSPTVPKDIYLRMDAIKRQLQILDSKTFAIIPPPKYSAFHSLIRESIAETYQACTAIMGYLQENNAEDLRVIRDHLLRARMLIQRTRPRPNQG